MRGSGKVVPRQAKRQPLYELSSAWPPGGSQQQQQQQQLPAEKLVSAGNQDELSPVATIGAPINRNPSTITLESGADANSRQAATLSAIAPYQEAALKGLQWRCASYLEGGAPQQILANALGTYNGQRLLLQHRPVLIRGQNLATCKLANMDNKAGAGCCADIAQHTEQQHINGGASEKPTNTVNQQTQPLRQQERCITVLCSPAHCNRFYATDNSKNLPGSYYHLRRPETSQLQMTFSDWLSSWQTWRHSKLLLQADICTWKIQSPVGEAAQQPSPASQPSITLWPNQSLAPHLPQLLQTVHAKAVAVPIGTTPQAGFAANSLLGLLDWQQLHQLLEAGQWCSQGRLQLLAGGRDALMPARYETSDRVICQVAGHQRLLLLPPELGFKGLYPYPVAHPYDKYSCVDWEEPELDHWPAAAQVKGLVCELHPGDTLIVPASWFVHTQLQQPACVALVLLLQPNPSKSLSPAGLLMQLSRMVEVWVTAEVGPANVRKWLMALAQGREWQLLAKQLTTVKGYKQLRMCELVMEQLQGVLSLQQPQIATAQSIASADIGSVESEGCSHASGGVGGSELECAARQLLGAMCTERLMPTHWLNEGIDDSLYLKYQPQYYEISEDEEAARYPTLFKHRLIEHRPDWMKHAKQLQLPGNVRHHKLLPT